MRPATRASATTARRDRPPRPAPWPAGDHQPGSGVSSGSAADWGDRTERIDRVTPGRAAGGPIAGYAPSGGARPGTGPMAARPGTGPISAWSSQAGYTPSVDGPASVGSSPATARPHPRPAGGAAVRPLRRLGRADGADQPSQRRRLPGASSLTAAFRPPGRPSAPAAGATSGAFGVAPAQGTPGRGRVDNSRVDNSLPGRQRPDRQRADRRPGLANARPPRAGSRRHPRIRPYHRGLAPGRPQRPSRRRSGWRPPWRRRPPDERRVLARSAATDGRSYRVAARRSQAQAKLTEQTQVFSAPTGYQSDQHRTGQYETGLTGEYPTRQYDTGASAAPGGARGGQYQTGATGDYPTSQHRANGVSGVTGKSAADQYRTGEYQTGDYRSDDYQTGDYGQYRADGQPSDPRYPGYAGSQSGPSGQLSSAVGSSQPAQPGRRGQQAPVGPGGSNAASGPNGFGGQPVGNPGRASLPNAIGAPSGQYPAQQPRHRQPRPQSQPPQSQATPPPVSGTAVAATAPARPAATPGTTGGQGGNGQSGGEPGRQRSGPVAARRHRAEPLRVGGHGFLSLSQPALPGPPGAVRQPDERREPGRGRTRRTRRTRR